MQKLTYIDANKQETVFGLTAPFVFWKIEGIGLPRIESEVTQASGQNGCTLHSVWLEPREITVTGHVHGAGIKEMYEERRRLLSALNPLSGCGTLVYENDAGIWTIPAYPSASPYLSKVRNVQTLSVKFECPSPFWLSAEETEIKLAYVDGGFEFPVSTPSYFGTLGYRAEIMNDSDAELPLEISIGGGARNPEITNEVTGEKISVERQIKEGDSLFISTDPETLEVSLLALNPATNEAEKENAYGYLTTDSTLLTLKPGRNELIFRSLDDNKKIQIRIRFRKRYVGV